VIECNRVYDALLAEHGRQQWWPADERFEILVGALLVQRTAWRNVETAIVELKRRELLDAAILACTPVAVIEECVRRTGFFRAKASRLTKLARFVVAMGGLAALDAMPTATLRRLLLDLDGIGPETADAILLYAFDRPVVVVDTYLRRLARRLAGGDSELADTELRAWVGESIGETPALSELHALVVAHGKAFCRKEPLCNECPMQASCRSAVSVSDP
jgi:endonuclease-3 related protein